LLQKKSDPTSAFFQGRLQIKGDMGLAMKLLQVFKNPLG
jgi:putative sterol carrier protein